MNRTTTGSGARLLAQWLATHADGRQTITDRQNAVQELAPKLDWRQNFQVSGMQFESANSDYEELLKWIEEPPQLLPSRKQLLTASLPLAAASTAALLYFLYHFFFHLRDLSGGHILSD